MKIGCVKKVKQSIVNEVLSDPIVPEFLVMIVVSGHLENNSIQYRNFYWPE
jgi:hypothetical protein